MNFCQRHAGYAKHYVSTLKHKYWVFVYMWRLYPAISNHVSWRKWLWRSLKHDWSKFTKVQARDFAAVIGRLSKAEYGSKEYKANTRLPGIQLHVRTEDHHPQYWIPSDDKRVAGERAFTVADGFKQMCQISRREMIADWAAAVRRNPNGDLAESIRMNKERFGYSEQEEWKMLAYAVVMGAISENDWALYYKDD